MNKILKTIFIILAELALVGGSVAAGVYLFDGSEKECKTEDTKETTTDTKKENSEEPSTENLLAEIQKVYEDGREVLYSEFEPGYSNYTEEYNYNGKTIKVYKINKERIGEYFTSTALDKILIDYSALTQGEEFYVTQDILEDSECYTQEYFDPGTIFSSTDADIRTLKILVSDENYVLAQAEITKTEHMEYGNEYIAFTKENGKWKIAFFE